MDDVDGLLQMCCAVPADATRRGALADKLAELGEVECEEALRSADGEKVIREVFRIADAIKRAPCLRLLWCVAVVEGKFPPTVITAPVRQIDEETRRAIEEMWRQPQIQPIWGDIVVPDDGQWHMTVSDGTRG